MVKKDDIQRESLGIEKLKRQGMTVTIQELRDLADDLESQCRQLNLELDIPTFNPDSEFMINIINKTQECSDTWEIEK